MRTIEGAATGETIALDLVEHMTLTFEVERFLYHEAQLLDELRFDEWMALMDFDVTYRAPVRITREGSDDVAGDNEMHFFDDEYGELELRLAAAQVGSAWAEIPPSRTRRFITNIRATPFEDGSIRAESNFLLYRSRDESVEHYFAGTRVDRLLRFEDSFKIRERLILFDRVAFHTDNISQMF